jgi:hypothetical protein
MAAADSQAQLILAIPQGFYEPIGKVAANFAAVEGCIDFAIWTLTGGNQHSAQDRTRNLSAFDKINLLRDLYIKRNPYEKFSTIDNLCNSLHKARIVRNETIHAQWGVGGIKFHPKTSDNGEVVDTEDIIKVAHEIAITGALVQKFLATHILKI